MSLLKALLGAGGARVSISDVTVSDSTITPTNASAEYSLTSAGAISQTTIIGGTVSLGNWITPTGAAGAAYEVRATELSNPVSTGTVGSWLALNSTQSWSRTRTVLGIIDCILQIEIRRASDGLVLDTATITLSAEKTT